MQRACENLDSEVTSALVAASVVTGLGMGIGMLAGNHKSPNDFKSIASGAFAGFLLAIVFLYVLRIFYRNSGRKQ